MGQDNPAPDGDDVRIACVGDASEGNPRRTHSLVDHGDRERVARLGGFEDPPRRHVPPEAAPVVCRDNSCGASLFQSELTKDDAVSGIVRRIGFLKSRARIPHNPGS